MSLKISGLMLQATRMDLHAKYPLFGKRKTIGYRKSFSNAKWVEIGGQCIYARSLWEANYARYLEWQKERGYIVDWLHEPKTFWFENIKRGVRSYLPDFKVIETPEKWHWVEVKGYMDAKSKTKLTRFKKYYPKERLVLIDETWFRRNSSKIRLIIPDWERGNV